MSKRHAKVKMRNQNEGKGGTPNAEWWSDG